MFENIPKQLKEMNQWVCYQAIPKGERITKVPVNPSNGKAIDVNNKENWLTFNEAVHELNQGNNRISGIGFVFSDHDPFVGIDLDDCINKKGELSSLANEVVQSFANKAYIEFSPSGRGIHVIAIGKKPNGPSKNADYGIEMYDQKRYFTVTANHLYPIEVIQDCTREVHEIFRNYMTKKEDDDNVTIKQKGSYNKGLTEEGLLNIMFSSKGGERLRSLYDGHWENYHSSQSEADLALCNALAFYTAKDANEMDRMFRQSGLFRKKWDQIHYADGSTYGEVVINKAIEGTSVVFTANEVRTALKPKQVDNKDAKKDLPAWYEQTQTSMRFKPGVLAKHLAETANFIYSNERFFKYEHGVYKEMPLLKVKSLIQENLLDEHSKSHHIQDTLEQWKTRIAYEGDLMDNPNLTDMINFKNGMYDLNNNTLLPHSPLFYTAVQVNAQYDPSATCPQFKKFIQESLNSSDALIAQELVGYLLIPSVAAEKAFILYGPGRSGKSTFLKVIEQILGKDQISNVALQDLSQRFKASLLLGKLANIYADLPNKSIQDTGVFKTLVSGDSIVAEEKFGTPFSFSNKARLVFSCNELPSNYVDRTDGFYRRLIILPFLRQVPETEIDPFLLQKFQDELDGIIQWALEGLHRLIKNKFQFTKSQSNKALLADYRKQSNNVIWFVEEHCELIPEQFEYSRQLYQHYKQMCLENGLQPISQTKFNKSLENDYPKQLLRTEESNSKRVIFKGIRIRRNI